MALIRGELHCFACGRFLGDFESHPEEHGRGDIHLLEPKEGALRQHAVKTQRGFACSHCGGRAVAQYVDLLAA